MKKLILITLAMGTLLGLTGCFNGSVDEGTIPWAKPAAWEGQSPGMGF